MTFTNAARYVPGGLLTQHSYEDWTMKSKKPKRKKTSPELTAILQLCPRGRVRLDPTLTPAITAYILAHKRRHETALAAEWDTTSAEQREAAKHNRQYHRHCCTALDMLLDSINGTLSVDDVDAAREMLNGQANPDDGQLIVRINAEGRLESFLPEEV